MSGVVPDLLRHRSPYGFDRDSFQLNSPRISSSNNFSNLNSSKSGERNQFTSYSKLSKNKLFKVKKQNK